MGNKITIVGQLLDKYNFLKKDDFYKEKRSGKDIIKHHACERIARHEGVKYSEPRFLKTERDHSVLYCAATIGEGADMKMEWTVGEADLKSNCFNQYVHSMAEKRCKDRLILKLIGVYGEIYSSEEDFVDNLPKPEAEIKMATDPQKKLVASLINQTGNKPLEDEEYDSMTMADASKLIDLYNEEKSNKGE